MDFTVFFPTPGYVQKSCFVKLPNFALLKFTKTVATLELLVENKNMSLIYFVLKGDVQKLYSVKNWFYSPQISLEIMVLRKEV